MPPTIAISELMATRPETRGDRLRGHHVEAEPADAEEPGAEGEPGDRARRVGPAVGAVAAGAGAEAEDGGEREPAADGVDDDRAGEIMERGAEGRGEPGLDAEVAVPDEAFAEGVDEADDDRGGEHLRPELRALGDAARDDRGDRGGEGREEEEFDEAEALGAERAAFGGAGERRAPR